MHQAPLHSRPLNSRFSDPETLSQGHHSPNSTYFSGSDLRKNFSYPPKRGWGKNRQSGSNNDDSLIAQSTKAKNRRIEKNGVVLKFGTAVGDSVLNDIQKVPAGGGYADGTGGFKGSVFSFSKMSRKLWVPSKNTQLQN
ncbi:hypothetical protein AVEN_253703-1 [Araneus ventricosus]|uniref:Uncharacterized protein n=1 Tax=Araneus ventricosus TaxID=182803 RepID=A0A4Y2DYL9_ARAVE|nr:hypothetical protein AVEN_253703-1 [Araneus ventricosus]